MLTTEQCLLNPNRNPLTREEVEQRLLERDLGFERVVWLGSGLLNDHTDGHIDNLARFVAPGRVAIAVAAKDDPNEAVYSDAARRLRSTKLDVVTLPSPGRITGEDGDVIPASYMNFYIGNAVVVVPQYGAPNDQGAVDASRRCSPIALQSACAPTTSSPAAEASTASRNRCRPMPVIPRKRDPRQVLEAPPSRVRGRTAP